MRMFLDKVVLRRPERRDVESLYEYRNDSEIVCLLGGFSKGYSTKDIEDWIELHRTRDDEIVWVIVEKESDKCVGHVGLYNIDHRVQCAEFAIVIGDKTCWGKGFGKQVSRSVIEYGFKQLNLHRIKLTVLATNVRAVKFYEKIGFRKEGTLRHEQYRDNHYVDVLMMGMLENEW